MIDAAESTAGVPIREVSRLTGVNAVTLRAWERRYGLIKPLRTGKGHRLYTQDDIALIQTIQSWLARGVSIGKVRDLLEADSEDLAVLPEQVDGEWQGFRQRAFAALHQLNEKRLDSLFNEVLALYPLDTVIQHFLQPLITHLRSQDDSFGSAAERAFLRQYLRNKLTVRLYHGSHNHGPLVLVHNLGDASSELNAMVLGLILVQAGYRVTVLDGGMPPRELIFMATKTEAAAAILYSDNSLSREVLDTDLPKLLFQAELPLWLAGDCLTIHDGALQALDCPQLPAPLTQAPSVLQQALEVSP